MKRRNRILLAALVVMVIGGLAWVGLRKPPEPVYQGRTLTDWLLQYARETLISGQPANYFELPNESKTAVRNIGTNAVPTLLKLVSAHDSPWKINIKRWIRQLKTKAGLSTNSYQRDAYTSHTLAIVGFKILGSDGKDAVPALINLLKSQHDDVRGTVRDCLGCIGPSAKDAVPELIRELNDVHMRFWAIITLGRIGENAKPAVPLLLQYLNDKEQAVRDVATDALQQIDPEAASKAGVK
jgi:hypothetical protein